MFAVSNQEDILLCGAGMRINRRILAGPGAGAKRLIVRGLSAADCRSVSGGLPSHFPVLVQLELEGLDGVLDRSVELSRVRALIFRTEEERDRVAYVHTGDVRLDDVATEVHPELFDMESSQISTIVGDDAALGRIASVNRIAGAVCGALVVIRGREDSAISVAPLFGLEGDGLLSALARVNSEESRSTSEEAILLQACARTLVTTSERLQEDLGAIADELLSQTRELAPALRKKVEQWRAWLQPRIDYVVPIALGDLTDPQGRGSPVLRAMTLLLFRQNLRSLVAQKREPRAGSGPLVGAIAGALAGFVERLDSIDVSFKSSMTGVLDTIACQLDAGPPFPPDLSAQFSVTEEQVQDSTLTRLYFRPTGKTVYEGAIRRTPLTLRLRDLLETSGFDVRETPEGYEVSDHGEVVRLTRVKDGPSDAEPPDQPKTLPLSTAPTTMTAGSKGPTARAATSEGEIAPATKAKTPRTRNKAVDAHADQGIEAGSMGPKGPPEGLPARELESSDSKEAIPSAEVSPHNPRRDPVALDSAATLPKADMEERPRPQDLFGADQPSAGAPPDRKRKPRTSNPKPRSKKPKVPPV